MDIINEMFRKSVNENEKNLQFWEAYLQNLNSLDFNVYNEKLKVPVLVPIGSRILFRGQLKHTNEVTVALGADYFTKCSLKQAVVLLEHRIKVAQEKVGIYKQEREYLKNQMSFTKQHVYEHQGQEIIEYHTVEEDEAWKEKHRINVKNYIQNRGKKEKSGYSKDDVADEELWIRLEELELQEELENELYDNNASLNFIIYKETIQRKDLENNESINRDEAKAIKEIQNMKVIQDTKIPEQHLKLDLLQRVINRQNELDEKLQELKNNKGTQSRTESDLLSKLDELEQLDELEDEMDRLDDLIVNEDDESSEEDISSRSDTQKLHSRVSFVDEDDSETLTLTFKHSDVDPNNEPYKPDKGIQKPSDIYKAYSNYFKNGTKSILKKSKYTTNNDIPEIIKVPTINVAKKQFVQAENQSHFVHQEIIVKDVMEKVEQCSNTLQTKAKPMSLFKKKRMQNKT